MRQRICPRSRCHRLPLLAAQWRHGDCCTASQQAQDGALLHRLHMRQVNCCVLTAAAPAAFSCVATLARHGCRRLPQLASNSLQRAQADRAAQVLPQSGRQAGAQEQGSADSRAKSLGYAHRHQILLYVQRRCFDDMQQDPQKLTLRRQVSLQGRLQLRPEARPNEQGL